MLEKNKFYKPETIEQKANELLGNFQLKFGNIKGFPIPAEKILERHLNLNQLWEKIREKENERILAGLVHTEKTVVLNEAHRDYFDEHQGLEAFTLAHEIGHWELHVDQGALGANVLPGFSRPYSQICRDGDTSWDEINANKFAAFLLMPKHLFLPLTKNFNLMEWTNLYRLKDIVGVTISALTNRLADLNLVYVGDDKKIYKSKEVYLGQKSLL